MALIMIFQISRYSKRFVVLLLIELIMTYLMSGGVDGLIELLLCCFMRNNSVR